MKYEDYQLIEYLLQAHHPKSSDDIWQHLRASVNGYSDRNSNRNNDIRKIQSRLKSLTECDQFKHMFEVTADGPGNRYKGVGPAKSSKIEMSVEQACALLMAEKHLSVVAPTRLFQSQSDFQLLIDRAKLVVEKHQQHHRVRENRNIHDFLNRITVVQRGQRLVAHNVDNQVLECIANCILQQKCIKLKYKGHKRVLHPYGLVFRQPKIYLLAADDQDLKENGPSQAKRRQFLCNRIVEPMISRQAHQVPEDFDLDEYVHKGRLDLTAYANDEAVALNATLVLRIHSGPDNGNLVRDLQEFPLAEDQQLVPEQGTENHILTAPGMRITYMLLEWILGRMDRVEVIGPGSLRKHVSDKLDAMSQHYT